MSPSRGAGPRLLELAWNHNIDAVMAIDIATELLVDANPAAELLTGYTRDELIGTHPSLLHPEEERAIIKQTFRQAPNRSAVLSDFHLQHKDGHLIPIRTSSSPPIESAGHMLSILTFTDITALKASEYRLSTQNWALSAYAAAISALNQEITPEELLQSLCEAITCESAYLVAWVGIAEDDPGKTIRVAAYAGPAKALVSELSTLSWDADTARGQSSIARCIRTGETQVVQDAEQYWLEEWRELARRYGVRSSVAVPFGMHGSQRGGLLVYAAQPQAFSEEAIRVFQHLAGQIDHGLHALEQDRLLREERTRLVKTQQQLTETLTATVSAMSVTMEKRDPYTAGHESRTAEIAYAIGKEMGWCEDRLLGLRFAALMHDIGKIAIPSAILNKPTALTAAERTLIQEHPETAYLILKDIPFIWPVADIVRQHHEKLDGSGYPLGIQGDAILPESRVLAVADIVEAMASARPFRPALGLDAALAEIAKLAGTKLDAEVVRICTQLFREKRLELTPS
ncbi:MAG: HD domain-containing phosphohydrolase [Acidobacteriaceae bacterium]|nr:HD domain-containing phosphohydrolase [Acidobacteriaceae bacterium]